MPSPANASIAGTMPQRITDFNPDNAPQGTKNRLFPRDPYATRKPDYFVGIFNVAMKDREIIRSWPVGKKIVVKARSKDDFWGKPYILPDIKNIFDRKAGNPDMIVQPTDGIFLAQDVINPTQPFGNWRTSNDTSAAVRCDDNNNYYQWGLFWCKLATPESDPDPEAVDTAIERLEKTYNALLAEADQFYVSGPAGQAAIQAPHHEAADYFIQNGVQIDRDWHKELTSTLRTRARKAAEAKKNKE